MRRRILTDEEIQANVDAISKLRQDERSKYNAEFMCKKVVEILSNGGTQYECCLAFDITPSTFYEYINPTSPFFKPEFSQAVNKARAAYRARLRKLVAEKADGSNKDIDLAAINKLERETIKPMHDIHSQPLLIQEYLKALKKKDFELASDKLDEAVLNAQVGTQRYEIMSKKLQERMKIEQQREDNKVQEALLRTYELPANARILHKKDEDSTSEKS